MIVENTKRDQIKNVIIKVANNTYGITQEHIRKAVERYINDERDIEIIEQELWTLSKQVEEEARLREERMKNVNKMEQLAVNESQSHPQQQSVFDTRTNDNGSEPDSKLDEEETVNLQEPTLGDNLDELSSMFADAPKKEQSQTYQAEKGRALVKTPTSNNRGQATFLNLCFIFSTISILGLIISTVILYAQKLFN